MLEGLFYDENRFCLSDDVDNGKRGFDVYPPIDELEKMFPVSDPEGLFWNKLLVEFRLLVENGLTPPLYLKLEVGLNEKSPAFFVKKEEEEEESAFPN